MPQQSPEQVKEYWDSERAAKRKSRQIREANGISVGQFILAVIRNVVRAACVVMILFGLISLFVPFSPRFLSDNTMGATANAAERMVNQVRAGIFIGAGIGLFVLFRKPKDMPE